VEYRYSGFKLSVRFWLEVVGRSITEHSRIESAINALENHGLDCCPDKGKIAYERYVGLAIVARNILQLGKIVMAKERKIPIAA